MVIASQPSISAVLSKRKAGVGINLRTSYKLVIRKIGYAMTAFKDFMVTERKEENLRKT